MRSIGGDVSGQRGELSLAPGFFMIRVPLSDRRCLAERGLYFSRPVQGPGGIPGRLVPEQGARALDKPLRPRSSYLRLASDKRRRRSREIPPCRSPRAFSFACRLPRRSFPRRPSSSASKRTGRLCIGILPARPNLSRRSGCGRTRRIRTCHRLERAAAHPQSLTSLARKLLRRRRPPISSPHETNSARKRRRRRARPSRRASPASA